MPVAIALVGRPNVGKSTLFNQLTRSRDALVADFPGLTRDRRYGHALISGRECLLIDTGGIEHEQEGSLARRVQAQTQRALEESDMVLWLTDARDGVTVEDEEIARRLRTTGKPVLLAVNKIDGIDINQASEFHALGMGEPVYIAAAHGRGFEAMSQRLAALWEDVGDSALEVPPADVDGIRIAVIGRPNAGKSTLVNRLLGEERMLTDSTPGTTRDAIATPFERDGQRYVLIDTAGVRRRARVDSDVEKLSVIKALKAVESAHVAILVLNAHDGIADQDASLLGLTIEAGRALVIAINKWDAMDEDQKQRIERELDLKLAFCDFAERLKVSALHGSGVGLLLEAVQRAHASSMLDVSTSRLTKLLEQAVHDHQPPMVKGRRIKLRYAHQGGRNPPRIVIHGNQTSSVPGSYRRYLQKQFRTALGMVGVPLRLEFRTSKNPYVKTEDD